MGQDPLKDRASTSSEADEEWRSRTHLGIMIENIPSHWMISDLKSFFDTFGTIVKAEIFEDRQVPPITYFLKLDRQTQWSRQSGVQVCI